MENKDKDQTTGQVASSPGQTQRPFGGKVIQPTAAILQKQESIQNSTVTPTVAPPQAPQPTPLASQPTQPTPPATTSQNQAVASSIYPEATQGINATPGIAPAQDKPEDAAPEFTNIENASPVQLLAVSCISALFFTFLIWLQVKFNGHLAASSGSFFSFFPYVLNIGNLLLLAAVGVLATYLTKSRTDFTGWTRAGLLTLPGIALVGTFYVNYITFSLGPWFSFLEHLPSWFNTWPWIFITSAILLFITYNISALILRLTVNRKSLGTACCLALAVLFIGLVYLIKGVETHKAIASINKPLQSTSSNNSSNNSNSASNNLNFDVYAPTYIPQGYSLDTFSASGPGFRAGDQGIASHFHIIYTNNETNLTIWLDSYLATSQFNPPQDCGTDANGNKVGQCQLIGNTPSGGGIYYFNNQGTHEYFAKIGDSIINLTNYNWRASNQMNATLESNSEILKIYDSLQAVPKQQLGKYSAST